MKIRSLQDTFTQLASKWKDETCFLSSTSEICSHPDYLKIIDMGDCAIPLILDEMRRRPGHWFHALRELTGEDPVQEQNCGNIPAMTEDWLSWADHD